MNPKFFVFLVQLDEGIELKA